MNIDPYEVLNVSYKATLQEIKSSYRALAKKYHPDAGGDEKTILAINAAWEILRDQEKRFIYDSSININKDTQSESKQRGIRNANAANAANRVRYKVIKEEDDLIYWMKNIYLPIDKLLSQIINPFTKEIKALSADPYDDNLMDKFCSYIEKSQQKLCKIEKIYRSFNTPISAKEFSLSLYYCFSQTEEAMNEIQKYTLGYVDNYLYDGKEMLTEAKKIRQSLQKESHRIKS